jgi:hypothetical protein
VTAYLRAVAGGHELLIDSASVLRVSEVDETAATSGDAFALLDLATLLGDGAPGRIVIVCAAGEDDAGPLALAVDEVKGLVTLDTKAVMRLPLLSDRFAQLFDGIAIVPIDGRHPLCLRSRLDLNAIQRGDA